MVKKISFLILSVAILTIGVIAFSKLSYWDRSVRIFSFNSDAPFEGRMGRGPEGRGEFGETGRFNRQERPGEGFARPEMREIPDSIRARFEAGEGKPEMRDRNMPDSLRQQFRRNDGERMGRAPFEGGVRNGEGRGRDEFPGEGKINLRNFLWFLAVFALFTVLSIYIDKAFCLVRKRKLR
jgi:hypothetical protein